MIKSGLFFLYKNVPVSIKEKLKEYSVLSGKNFIILKNKLNYFFPNLKNISSFEEHKYHQIIDGNNSIIVLANNNYDNSLIIKNFFIKKPFEDTSILNIFSDLDLSNKKELLIKLDEFRKEVFSKKNKNWFLLIDEDNTFFYPSSDGFERIESKEMFDKLNIDRIDSSKLWDRFIWPVISNLFF